MKTEEMAYVLHRRPYRETSFLVDFFTQHHGVVSMVCRGVRRGKQTLSLEPFHPFWIEYNHRHHLASLYQWELAESTIKLLVGIPLYCSLYINELLIKLLGHHDPYPGIFEAYKKVLSQLSTEINYEPALRSFEFYLLKETGYEIPMERDAHTLMPIRKEKHYYYNPAVGFTETSVLNSSSLPIFEGDSILSIGQNHFSDEKTLKESKRLIRITLGALLEQQGPLKSRDLFIKY